jgi:hypothetical protein
MLAPARRLRASAKAVAVSTGGLATSHSTAAGKNSVSSSHAVSSGNGTALSVGIANGTSTLANSSATATGENACMHPLLACSFVLGYKVTAKDLHTTHISCRVHTAFTCCRQPDGSVSSSGQSPQQFQEVHRVGHCCQQCNSADRL